MTLPYLGFSGRRRTVEDTSSSAPLGCDSVQWPRERRRRRCRRGCSQRAKQSRRGDHDGA